MGILDSYRSSSNTPKVKDTKADLEYKLRNLQSTAAYEKQNLESQIKRLENQLLQRQQEHDKTKAQLEQTEKILFGLAGKATRDPYRF